MGVVVVVATDSLMTVRGLFEAGIRLAVADIFDDAVVLFVVVLLFVVEAGSS